MERTARANECGHLVETFDFMASCSDGVIRTSICAPLICDSCRVLREANGLASLKGSRVIGYRPDEYRGQKPEWKAELLRLLALEQERAKNEVIIAWPRRGSRRTAARKKAFGEFV